MTEEFNYYRGIATRAVYRPKPGLEGTEFFDGREWVSLTGSDRDMRDHPGVFEALPCEPVEVKA